MKTSKSYYVSVILMPIWHILQGIKAGAGVGGWTQGGEKGQGGRETGNVTTRTGAAEE